MRMLVLNLGSTSFKCALWDMPDERALAWAQAENIGGAGTLRASADGRHMERPCACQTHPDALALCLGALQSLGVAADIASLDAVAYKAVHGGTIRGARRVDDALLEQMDRLCALAPAHNPIYTGMMRALRAAYPAVAQVACFETAFHHTVPEYRMRYGVPDEWAARYGVRRYGFHGASHSYVAWRLSQEAPAARRVLSLHLGGSCSLCAILDGKSAATTMGATPQSGIFQNNRVGDLDVFCLPVLADALGGLQGALDALATRGGLLGLSGVSRDLRPVMAAAAAGNARAKLAVDAFTDAVIGYAGMMTAYLGGLDAMAFTGGIGFSCPALRARVCAALSYLGVWLDEEKNAAACGSVERPQSRVRIFVFETDEARMVARAAYALLTAE